MWSDWSGLCGAARVLPQKSVHFPASKAESHGGLLSWDALRFLNPSKDFSKPCWFLWDSEGPGVGPLLEGHPTT